MNIVLFINKIKNVINIFHILRTVWKQKNDWIRKFQVYARKNCKEIKKFKRSVANIKIM